MIYGVITATFIAKNLQNWQRTEPIYSTATKRFHLSLLVESWQRVIKVFFFLLRWVLNNKHTWMHAVAAAAYWSSIGQQPPQSISLPVKHSSIGTEQNRFGRKTDEIVKFSILDGETEFTILDGIWTKNGQMTNWSLEKLSRSTTVDEIGDYSHQKRWLYNVKYTMVAGSENEGNVTISMNIVTVFGDYSRNVHKALSPPLLSAAWGDRPFHLLSLCRELGNVYNGFWAK